MLSFSVVKEVERLLAEGRLSRRRIAARLGVSKSSVAMIASGKRGTWGRESKIAEAVPSIERCPACGVLVTVPCVACRARRYQRQQRLTEGSTGVIRCDNLAGAADVKPGTLVCAVGSHRMYHL